MKCFGIELSEYGLLLKKRINYYPFGLKHKGYNNVINGTENNYKTFQGQEISKELGYNMLEFKYRHYDPATARFVAIDPLAMDYVYNSTYAFQENKLGMGTELEGKELLPHPWMVADAAANPNGVSAHAFGVSNGLANTVTGIWDAVTNPGQTLKGMANMMVLGASNGNPATAMQLDNALGTNSLETGAALSNAIDGAVNDVVSGNGFERGTVIGEVIGAVAGTKGANVATKAVTTSLKANKAVNVFRVFGGDAKASGFSWTPKDPINVANFRDAAGLPSGGASGAMNTAESLIQGTVKNKNIIQKRSALPLDGNKGGLPEYIIDPKNVNVKSTTKMN